MTHEAGITTMCANSPICTSIKLELEMDTAMMLMKLRFGNMCDLMEFQLEMDVEEVATVPSIEDGIGIHLHAISM